MLMIFTGYKWREITELELEILTSERVLTYVPDEPQAGNVLEHTLLENS